MGSKESDLKRVSQNNKFQVIQRFESDLLIPKRWRSLNHLKGSRFDHPTKVTIERLPFVHRENVLPPLGDKQKGLSKFSFENENTHYP